MRKSNAPAFQPHEYPLVIAVVGPESAAVAACVREIWPRVVIAEPSTPEPHRLDASVVLILGGTETERAACARRGHGEVWKASLPNDNRVATVEPGVERFDRLVLNCRVRVEVGRAIKAGLRMRRHKTVDSDLEPALAS